MIGCQGTSSDSTMSADAQWAPTQSALRTPRATSHCQGQGTMLGRQPHNLPSPPHSSATASRLRRPLSALVVCTLSPLVYSTIPSLETPQRCHTTLHTSTSLLQSWGLYHHTGILHSRHMRKQRSREQMTPRAHANT